MAPTTIVIESDIQAHVEDTHLFSLFRNGRHVKLTWNELTDAEREQQLEAARRAAFNTLFSEEVA